MDGSAADSTSRGNARRGLIGTMISESRVDPYAANAQGLAKRDRTPASPMIDLRPRDSPVAAWDLAKAVARPASSFPVVEEAALEADEPRGAFLGDHDPHRDAACRADRRPVVGLRSTVLHSPSVATHNPSADTGRPPAEQCPWEGLRALGGSIAVDGAPRVRSSEMPAVGRRLPSGSRFGVVCGLVGRGVLRVRRVCATADSLFEAAVECRGAGGCGRCLEGVERCEEERVHDRGAGDGRAGEE